jgi:ABC-2 type transport system ATP-binding protein
MAQPVIELSALTKFYGKARGIDNLNLSISEGEIFGFLGPNGAGKSTTIRLLLHLIHPDSGDIRVFGQRLEESYHHIFRDIGNVPGELHMYESLTGNYFLDFMNRLSAGREPVLRADLSRRFGLDDKTLQRRIKYYSRGMKQKLALISAMQEKPRLLVMDEPSEGLDPLTRSTLYEILEEFQRDGHTVFFSSHNLAEVEKICNRVGLVRESKLIALDSIAEMKNKKLRRLDISFAVDVNKERLQIEGAQVEQLSPRQFVIHYSGDLNRLLIVINQYPLVNMVFPEPSLEELFMGYYN